MADVFDVLSADHTAVQRMLGELEAGPDSAAGATSAQLAARLQVAEELIVETAKHEAVEEQYFWPAVRDRVPGGYLLADYAVSQEDEAIHVLARLEKLGPGDREFDDLLAKFIPAARDHIDYEEGQVWPQLRQVLSAAQAEDLASKVADGKKTAPTRPYPRSPVHRAS